MLAVIGIMLVLMVATFGIFNMLGQRMGPETALSTVQAMLNGARDYAATNGVLTQVVFCPDNTNAAGTVDPSMPQERTVMRLQYKSPTAAQWSDVRGRKPVALGDQIFVCRWPDSLNLPGTPPAFNDPKHPTESEIQGWKNYEKGVLDRLSNDFLSSGKIQSPTSYAVFDPSGYMKTADIDGAHNASNTVELGLVVVQVGAGRVVGYAFYSMNSHAGTRIIFEW
jgi:hypothetical protein